MANKKAKILLDFQTQRDRQILASHPDIVVVDKAQKIVEVMDLAVPATSGRKGAGETGEVAGPEGGMERMWKVKTSVVPSVGRSTQGCDSQAGNVAPTDPWNDIRAPGPEKCNAGNS